MGVSNTRNIIEPAEKYHFNCYDHVQCINAERLPKQVFLDSTVRRKNINKVSSLGN